MKLLHDKAVFKLYSVCCLLQMAFEAQKDLLKRRDINQVFYAVLLQTILVCLSSSLFLPL